MSICVICVPINNLTQNPQNSQKLLALEEKNLCQSVSSVCPLIISHRNHRTHRNCWHWKIKNLCQSVSSVCPLIISHRNHRTHRNIYYDLPPFCAFCEFCVPKPLQISPAYISGKCIAHPLEESCQQSEHQMCYQAQAVKEYIICFGANTRIVPDNLLTHI